ncbi:hypothetical protein [Dysgonomonas sp. 25]|uniref:hypothetical protein n=1 Tax=Dysgonomonas sp. 25 TaxID=2302933 RepID=UPI0013D81D5C|nr:hypothetical protein [Dysgonomonas sp. 25]NDV68888.1 hypothetical protein [Dysgonomonas sp. 25]
MKQVKILFLLLAVLLAGASCGSDDDDKVSYKNADLEGLWVANGWGSAISVGDSQISTLIKNSIEDMFGTEPTQIDGKYIAYYFDGDESGVQGVSSTSGLLDEHGRTNITYNVTKNILAINDGSETELIPIKLYNENIQMSFTFDLTKTYQDKQFMQELLNEAGLTHIDVNTIKVKEVKCHLSFLKVAAGT